MASFTYSTYDRFDLTTFTCDLNLRTGEYVANINDEERRGKSAPQHIPVTQWQAEESFPETCNSLLRETIE